MREGGREKGHTRPGVDRLARRKRVEIGVKTNRDSVYERAYAQVTPEFNWLLICAERLAGFPSFFTAARMVSANRPDSLRLFSSEPSLPHAFNFASPPCNFIVV